MLDPGAKGPVLSQRERSKEGRRESIRQAARELLRDTGQEGFSMRELAARAMVSPATPYNLYGTKSAVLLAVFDADLDLFRRAFGEVESANAVARMFDFVETAFAFFRREPDFYRNMLAPIAASSPAELRRGLIDPRAAVYSQLVDDIVETRALREGIPADGLLRTISNLMAIGVMNWVNGDSDLNAAQSDVETGYSFVLLAACSEDYGPFLRAKLRSQAGQR